MSDLLGPPGGESTHWEEVYSRKQADAVSWYRPHLEHSLAFIAQANLPKDARIVDVGGGASTLVDDLLAQDFRNVAVIDLASAALVTAQQRLGPLAERVDWIAGDATQPLLADHSVDFWHDRAVCHFLTDPAARQAYVDQVDRCVKPGGHVLIATFGPDGPEQCSGLPVMRYGADEIHDVFGRGYSKVGTAKELHTTPWGATQSFVYCFCRAT